MSCVDLLITARTCQEQLALCLSAEEAARIESDARQKSAAEAQRQMLTGLCVDGRLKRDGYTFKIPIIDRTLA